jgi:hypothetical protein
VSKGTTIICPACAGSGVTQVHTLLIDKEDGVVVGAFVKDTLACWKCDGAGVVERRPRGDGL